MASIKKIYCCGKPRKSIGSIPINKQVGLLPSNPEWVNVVCAWGYATDLVRESPNVAGGSAWSSASMLHQLFYWLFKRIVGSIPTRTTPRSGEVVISLGS